MHGNTVTAKSVGLKTRAFDDIMAEVKAALTIHKENSSVLAGIHLEITGQDSVTECTGGLAGITEEGLKVNYETYCDPRLNFKQAIEAAFAVGREVGPVDSGAPAKRQRRR